MTGSLAWYVARAAGLVSYVLLVATAVWGAGLAARVLRTMPGLPWLNAMHRWLSTLTWVFLGVHVGALLLDSYAGFGLVDVLVPLASRWHPVAVAYGVVGVYLLAVVTLTAALQRSLPKEIRHWWRTIHLASYAVLVLSTVHLFTAGTDAGRIAVGAGAGALVAAALAAGGYARSRA